MTYAHMPLLQSPPRAYAAPATSTSVLSLRSGVRPGSVSPSLTTPHARPVHLRCLRRHRTRGVRTARPLLHVVVPAATSASAAGGLDAQLAALPNLQVRRVREPAAPARPSMRTQSRRVHLAVCVVGTGGRYIAGDPEARNTRVRRSTPTQTQGGSG